MEATKEMIYAYLDKLIDQTKNDLDEIRIDLYDDVDGDDLEDRCQFAKADARNAIHRTELIMRMVSEFATAKNEKEVIDEQH